MKRVVFIDDIFVHNPSWLEEFVNDYRKKIRVPFGCFVHPLYVNEKVVELLKTAGCTIVNMGVQTLNESVKRRILYRNEDNHAIERAITLFKKAGILIYVDFMFGLPEESRVDAENAALFLSRTRPDAVGTLWLRYYPKSKIVDISSEKNLLSDQEIESINKGLDCVSDPEFGNSRSPIEKKLVSFVLISGNFSHTIVAFMLKHRFYRFLPKGCPHYLHTLIKQLFNKLRHKDGSLFNCSWGYIKYYGTYMIRFLVGTSE
jgi:radical SAM superfamily enzyme YgiQ (UPF0313 family)